MATNVAIPAGLAPEAFVQALDDAIDGLATRYSTSLQEALLLEAGFVTVPDDLAAAARAVAARRARSPIDVPTSTLRDRAATALANLEAAWDNWDTLTAVQKDAALKLNVRATAALIRLVLRRL